MAGYHSFSKSNNALAAEDAGLWTATALAKALRCETAAVRALLVPAEKHHTSCWYNLTDYYEEPVLVAVADAEPNVTPAVIAEQADLEVDGEDIEWALGMLTGLRAYRAGEPASHENCEVRWLSWAGSRLHPICVEKRENGCRVVDNGKQSYVIFRPDGGRMTKRKTTKGLAIRTAPGEMLVGSQWDLRIPNGTRLASISAG